MDQPLRRALRDERRTILRDWGTAAIVVTHDFTEAYQLGDRIVVYEAGRVINPPPAPSCCGNRPRSRWPGSGSNICETVAKATPDRIQIRWRRKARPWKQSTRPRAPTCTSARRSHRVLHPARYVRLIRKIAGHRTLRIPHRPHGGRGRGQADLGTTWTLRIRLDEPGKPAQGDYDLEVEVPRLVYEILEIDRDRHWQLSIHRGSSRCCPRDVQDRPSLAVQGIRRQYSPGWSLTVPALDIQAAELLAVIGPNGSSKSTLLRVLGLLETPDEGEVRYLGERVSPKDGLTVRRRMAMVL